MERRERRRVLSTVQYVRTSPAPAWESGEGDCAPGGVLRRWVAVRKLGMSPYRPLSSADRTHLLTGHDARSDVGTLARMAASPLPQ